MSVATHDEELGGLPIRWLEAPGGDPPVLYLHGAPTSGEIWRPFLERTGGLAPDLPGFGRSGKPGYLAYDLPFYADWIAGFLAGRGIDRFRLVAHDWGGAFGLALAQRAPERVERMVIMDAVPLLPGYRWHRYARIWRVPLLGELAMGFATHWGTRRALRAAAANPDAVPDEWIRRVWEDFDQGTQRAQLRLLRSADPDKLAAAGARLADVRCPALVVWGDRDPYIPARFAQAYASALPGAGEAEVVGGAGHWCWLDRPEIIDRVTAFTG